MSKHTQLQVNRETAIGSPIVSSKSSMDGICDGYPVEVMNNMDYYVHHNDFDKDSDFIKTATAPNTKVDFTVTAIGTNDLTKVGMINQRSFGALSIGGSQSNSGATVQNTSASVLVNPGARNRIPGAVDVLNKDNFFCWRSRVGDQENMSIFVGLAELNSESSVLSSASTEATVTSDQHLGFTMNSLEPGVFYATRAGSSNANMVQTEAFSIPGGIPGFGSYVDYAVRIWSNNQIWMGYRLRGRNTRSWKTVVHEQLAVPFTDTNNSSMRPTFSMYGAATTDVLDVDFFTLARYRDYYVSDSVAPGYDGNYPAV